MRLLCSFITFRTDRGPHMTQFHSFSHMSLNMWREHWTIILKAVWQTGQARVSDSSSQTALLSHINTTIRHLEKDLTSDWVINWSVNDSCSNYNFTTKLFNMHTEVIQSGNGGDPVLGNNVVGSFIQLLPFGHQTHNSVGKQLSGHACQGSDWGCTNKRNILHLRNIFYSSISLVF